MKTHTQMCSAHRKVGMFCPVNCGCMCHDPLHDTYSNEDFPMLEYKETDNAN